MSRASVGNAPPPKKNVYMLNSNFLGDSDTWQFILFIAVYRCKYLSVYIHTSSRRATASAVSTGLFLFWYARDSLAVLIFYQGMHTTKFYIVLVHKCLGLLNRPICILAWGIILYHAYVKYRSDPPLHQTIPQLNHGFTFGVNSGVYFGFTRDLLFWVHCMHWSARQTRLNLSMILLHVIPAHYSKIHM